MCAHRVVQGRPRDTKLAEELAALCALSRDRAATSPSELASLLGVSMERAQEILRLLSADTIADNPHEGNIGPMLALYSTGADGSMARVPTAHAPTLPALRLTPQQAHAVAAAFERLGMAADHPLRNRVERAFFPVEGDFPPPDPDTLAHGERPLKAQVDDSAPQRPVTEAVDAKALEAILICARSLVQARDVSKNPALVSQPVVSFLYQGDNDLLARTRRVIPCSLRLCDERWRLDAYDLDVGAQRTFLSPRMEAPTMTGEWASRPRVIVEHPDGGTLSLACAPQAAQRVETWPGATKMGMTDDGWMVIEVPYYRGDWLVRHLLALGGDVRCNSEELKAQLRAVAHEDLRRERRLRH